MANGRPRTSQRIWEYVSCTECTVQGNDFELIATVNMETSPVGGVLVVKFRRSVIIADLWRPEVKTLKIFEQFWSFLEKRPLTG